MEASTSITEIVKSIFDRHHAYYTTVGLETIQQQAGQIEQVTSDYQGRVIYELLQNAFDKANKKICVKVVGDTLYVANDGKRFTYVADYDFKKNTTIRGDFQSLCSISTTTKFQAKSIGNKGVGFKSTFSLARDGYVNIYSKGKVLKAETEEMDAAINFRIYEVFYDTLLLPVELNTSVTDFLGEAISTIQKTYPERGVPGYYFPIQIADRSETVNQLLEKGYVTVIEIPFADKDEVQRLFNDIKNYHFRFVLLKYPNYPSDFQLKFDFDGEVFCPDFKVKSSRLFSVEIDNEELRSLARAANIAIDKVTVALHLRDSRDGLLYNYLPVERESPFKWVDFHADFHTTVDRKSINFDSKVGAYNSALMRACLELFFIVIAKYAGCEYEVTRKYIDIPKVKGNLEVFNWTYFEINQRCIEYKHVTSLLSIAQWNYKIPATIFAKLAEKYFSIKRSTNDHDWFFHVVSEFAKYYVSNTNQSYIWVERFKEQLANKLKSFGCQVVPNSKLSDNSELFFRKGTDIYIPEFVGVNITHYEIKDTALRGFLSVREFTDYNEILKYYRQTTYSGQFESTAITEDQQREILTSLFSIFKNKKDSIQSTAHRYSKMFTSVDRQNNAPANHANFNVASIFLKTNDGRYRPAQLCRKKDLDVHFIPTIMADPLSDNFLRFLGVSTEGSYLFADGRVYDKLKDGLDYIPVPIKTKNEPLTSVTLEHIHLINGKGEKFHPSLINDNHYPYFYSISSSVIKSDLNLLYAKRYDVFPKEYCLKLFKHLESCPYGVEWIYPKIFTTFHRELSRYLVFRNNSYSWVNRKEDFYIARSSADYELLSKCNINLLCQSERFEIPPDLSTRYITLKEGPITTDGEKDVSGEIVATLIERMPYILTYISNSRLTELNFRDDIEKVHQINNRLTELKILSATKLFRQIESESVALDLRDEFDALIDNENKKIYFTETCGTRRRTEAICRYLFNNTRIVSEIEIIMFLKHNVSELEKDYANQDIQMFRSMWIQNFSERFHHFQMMILAPFVTTNEIADKKWHIYNAVHKSQLLIQLDNDNRLNELFTAIEAAKVNYDGLFDDFKLQIDYTLNNYRISKQITFLKTLHSEAAELFIPRLEALSTRLGADGILDELEQEIKNTFPNTNTNTVSATAVAGTERRLEFDGVVRNIHSRISTQSTLTTSQFNVQGNTGTTNIQVNKKKIIFQREVHSVSDEVLISTGASGEEQVLGYYIDKFLTIQQSERVKAIDDMHSLLKRKLGNDTHSKYKDACLKNINNDTALRVALIPFMYVTLSHRYAYFDLLVFDAKPLIIEVKTTTAVNNNSFTLSTAEVNEARVDDNYQIVRVTPTEIIFMGNPIATVTDKINAISGSNFSITPKSFKFEFSRS